MDLGVPPRLELKLATLVSRVGVPTAMLYGDKKKCVTKISYT